MGQAERPLIEHWAERLATANDPLAVWREEIVAPDVDYRAIEGAPDDVGPIVGRDAMLAYLADWYEMFDGFSASPEEILDAGPGREIVVWRIGGRAKTSGVVTDMLFATDYVIADGKIVRGREYASKEEALAAVGAEGGPAVRMRP
jgi:ketosteroid isomerase-like protein